MTAPEQPDAAHCTRCYEPQPCPCEPLPPARIGWRETAQETLFLLAFCFVVPAIFGGL